MFTVQEISLENFMNIDELVLKFDQNSTVAITGAKKKKKSTLFMAIAFCLTGYKRSDTYKEFIKTGEKEARVRMSALLAGEPISYDVTIQQSGLSRTVIYQGETYINSAYKQLVDKYKLDVLQNIMFMFQGNSSLIDATPSERSSMLKDLFQFDFSDVVDQFTQTQLNESMVKSTLTGSLAELETRQFPRRSYMREFPQSMLDSLKQEEESYIVQIEKLNSLDTSKPDRLEQELKSLANTMNATSSEIAGIQSRINTYDSRYKGTTLEDMTADRDAKVVELEDLQKKLEDAKTDLEHHRREESDLNSELKFKKLHYDEAKKHYDVGVTGVCLSCGNIIDEEHLKVMEQELNKAQAEMDEVKSQIDALNIPEVTKTYIQLDSQVRDLTAEVQRYDSQIARFEVDTEKHSYDIKALEQAKSTYEIQHKSWEDKKLELSQCIELKEKKNSELPTLTQELSEVREKLTKARNAVAHNEQARQENQRMQEEEESCMEKKKELSERINESLQKTKLYTECINVFRKSFPAFVVLQACRNLEAYINLIVQKAFPNLKVKLLQSRTGVGFFYSVDDSENWLNIAMASGAQRQVLQIANQIALAKMYNLQCIFLDEIDASCSDENARIIFEFIASLEDFSQVFFISHRKESLKIMKQLKDNIIFYDVQDGMYTELD